VPVLANCTLSMSAPFPKPMMVSQPVLVVENWVNFTHANTDIAPPSTTTDGTDKWSSTPSNTAALPFSKGHAEQTAGKPALAPVSIKSSPSAKKTPTSAGLCLPAGQGEQADDPLQTSPLLQEGHCKQVVAAWTGWYFPEGQSAHTPTAMYLPAGHKTSQSNRREVPVPVVVWPAGHSRHEAEAGAGWYLPEGHTSHTSAAMNLPAGQAMQPDWEVVPSLDVKWPEGQSKQAEAAGSGWYLDTGQELHPAGAQSLNPVQSVPKSKTTAENGHNRLKWKLNEVLPAGTGIDSGNVLLPVERSQYLVPPSTCK
jgi:hypothetical protein